MIDIILHGYKGQMGKVLTNLISEDTSLNLVAGIDRNAVEENFPTFTNINDCNIKADVIIDFSTASAIDGLIKYGEKTNIPIVLCTTGLSEDTLEYIDKAKENVAIFKSANMSLGINLIVDILSKYSKILAENGFDIEILERHHRKKIDAPSGTALLLADTINESLDNEYTYIYDRSNIREQRKDKEIGISALRGGTIVGEHDIVFAGLDEVIEINHKAYSKEVFAVGALSASKYIKGKKSGLYSMKDLMSDIL